MHLHVVTVEELLIPLSWSAEAFSVSSFEGTISSVAFVLRQVSSSECRPRDIHYGEHLNEIVTVN